MLPTNSHLNIEKSVPTQLLVIPAKNIDEYDMMMQEEEMGELVCSLMLTHDLVEVNIAFSRRAISLVVLVRSLRFRQ